MRDLHSLFHTAFILWIILDPFGNLPLFVSLLKHLDPKRQRNVIVRELLISLGIMILFLFFGYGFFQLINISESSLEISGGIILFLIAVRLIFSTHQPSKATHIPKEPFIVPLAVPAVAGPGVLATITVYSGGVESSTFIILIAIVLAWLALLPVLLFSPYLVRFLGENGIIATEKLFGYLVVLTSTEMVLRGLSTVLATL